MSTPGSTPSPDPAEAPRRLPPLLRRTWYSLNQAFRRRVSHLGITPDQFTILRWLYEHPGAGVTQRQLADLMASDPNTVTSVLNRMEASDLIERRPHASDRRAKIVKLKPRGRRAFEQARDIALQLQNQIMAVLPKSRREPFLSDLQKLADAARLASEQNDNPLT